MGLQTMGLQTPLFRFFLTKSVFLGMIGCDFFRVYCLHACLRVSAPARAICASAPACAHARTRMPSAWPLPLHARQQGSRLPRRS